MELTQRYQLETALFRLEQKKEETAQRRKQAKYDLRTRQQETTLYEGSFRAFLDKLSGKQAEKEETHRRALRQAEETLAALTRETEMLEQSKKEILMQLEQLPYRQTLCAEARKTPEGDKRWAKLETNLCAEQIIPLLAKTEEALEAYRSQLRGDRMGQIVSYEELHEIGTAHIRWAEQCRPLLQRLQEAMSVMDASCDIGGYFRNPAGYIVSAAAAHNRLDRANDALYQVEALRNQINGILKRNENE